jgi:integrase
VLRSGGIGALTTTVTPTGEATLLLSEGVHPKVVQELLGHATINITLDTYSHVLPELGDAAA